MRQRVSDIRGSCLWRFWRDWPRRAELSSWVTRFMLDVSWLVYQGGWFHADSARTGDLLRWGTLDCWGCCSLVARAWSWHRGNWCLGKLGKCDSLTLLGSGTSDWFGHRVLSLGVCDSLSLCWAGAPCTDGGAGLGLSGTGLGAGPSL